MRLLCEIADTIDVNLQFEYDCPSKNQGGKVPILDLQVWVDNNNRVRHTFYKKPCAPERTVMAGTALGARTKRNSVFQEGMRRVRALDQWATREEVDEQLEVFANVMRLSGYPQAYRAQVIEGVWLRNRQMDQEGVKARSGEEIKAAKLADPRRWKNTWFLRGTTTSTMMAQPTPGESLAAGIRKALAEVRGPDGGTTMVTEKAGRSILSGLMAADPALGKGCQWEEKPCPVEGEKSCWASRLVYSLDCTVCWNNRPHPACKGKAAPESTAEGQHEIPNDKALKRETSWIGDTRGAGHQTYERFPSAEHPTLPN